jgi:hypothetical protein
MKKLALALDDLTVESFSTDVELEDRGTVAGNSLPTKPLCSRYCPPTHSCADTATCTVDVCC